MIDAALDQVTLNMETIREYLQQKFPKECISEPRIGAITGGKLRHGYFFFIMKGIKVKQAVFCVEEFLENTPSDIAYKMLEDADLAKFIKNNKDNTVQIRSDGLSHLEGIYSGLYHDW